MPVFGLHWRSRDFRSIIALHRIEFNFFVMMCVFSNGVLPVPSTKADEHAGDDSEDYKSRGPD
jgi:hypothetical protein